MQEEDGNKKGTLLNFNVVVVFRGKCNEYNEANTSKSN